MSRKAFHTLRTLDLPRDFQVQVKGLVWTDVKKCSADSAFRVVERTTSFTLYVTRGVVGTRRSFVEWLLSRWRKWKASVARKAAVAKITRLGVRFEGARFWRWYCGLVIKPPAPYVVEYKRPLTYGSHRPEWQAQCRAAATLFRIPRRRFMTMPHRDKIYFVAGADYVKKVRSVARKGRPLDGYAGQPDGSGGYFNSKRERIDDEVEKAIGSVMLDEPWWEYVIARRGHRELLGEEHDTLIRGQHPFQHRSGDLYAVMSDGRWVNADCATSEFVLNRRPFGRVWSPSRVACSFYLCFVMLLYHMHKMKTE